MDLKNERLIAKNIIIHDLNFNAILYEGSPPESYAQEWWHKEINRSNFFIYILGNYVSWPIYDELKIARSIGIHILAFIKDENVIRNLISQSLNSIFDQQILNRDKKGNHWFLINSMEKIL